MEKIQKTIKMPAKAIPICLECKKTESYLWHSVDNGQLCQTCFEQRDEDASKEKASSEDSVKTVESTSSDDRSKKTFKDKMLKDDTTDVKETLISSAEEKSNRLRKSTRATRFKSKITVSQTSSPTSNGNGEKPTPCANSKPPIKGKNRRSLFKRTPFKTPHAQATTHTVESVFHKGSYIQIGDIVSLLDGEDNCYYAQVRGLLVDNYGEKSAFLTWLIPTQESPNPTSGFDPATYLIGPDEELSRKLSYLEFVMHAPSNYYLDRTTPFPLPDSMEYDTKPGGYIWTTLPEYHRPSKTIEV